ncbi:MAG TPA: alpha/beta fold hydrolase [Ilumatobacteraceae bacterium]|nr:alpha/beta fold hydrolase [Ilumatobacteraceae bacterium]
MTDLLVLHDLGAPGGDEWAAAFAGWPGRVLAPDLPGHNDTPPPVGGQYQSGDAVYVALELLRREAPEELVVVGVGHSGAAAQILALGGRAAGLVLLDGLGGPWLGPDEVDAQQRELRRRILTTPVALSGPTPGAIDPRTTMVVGAVDREFAVRQAAAMPVPVLLIETPASPTPDADELADHFDQATLVRVDARDPGRSAGIVRSWWTNR